jgi:hypothetical protein
MEVQVVMELHQALQVQQLPMQVAVEVAHLLVVQAVAEQEVQAVAELEQME